MKRFRWDTDTVVRELNRLADAKVIESQFSYPGAMIYLPGEMPEKAREKTRAKVTLKKLGLS